MIKFQSNRFLFFLSNIFYFLAILFTYIDLRKLSIVEDVYPSQFSYITYTIIIFFLINLFLLLNYESKNKFEVFNIFFYYLILSSGVYVINFPLMDELILITSSIFFLIHLIYCKKISYQSNYTFFILILFILFIQSIIGLLFDLRSVRYLFIFLSLIITFFYFSDLKDQEIDDIKHKIFFNYLFYGIIIYVTYQILFWFLKFYIFEMKFDEQRFIGNMQPSYAKSSSGHFDAIHILSGYMILYFSINSDSLVKKTLLFISIIAFWILADARSSLFLAVSILFFYFLILESKKKYFFILFLLLIVIQKNYFDNKFNTYLQRAENSIYRLVNIEKGTKVKAPVYKLKDGSYLFDETISSSYGDFGRLSFILISLKSIKYDFKVILGCGFYNYYYCAKDAIIEVHEQFNVPIKDNNKGFGNRPIRPTAAGTILVENGFFIILVGMIYYINSLFKNFYVARGKVTLKSKSTIISLYFFFTIMCWAIFSNLMDIIFFYLFLMPIFRKYIFYKI